MPREWFVIAGLLAASGCEREADAPAEAPPRAPAAAQPAAPSPFVPLRAWCESLAANFCRHCQPAAADRCAGDFVPACLSQRDPASPTDRTPDQVRECGVAIEAASCADIVQGRMPAACRARPQS